MLLFFLRSRECSEQVHELPREQNNLRLGYRPTAGHLTLDQRIEVRILVSQPFFNALFVQWPRTSGSQPGNKGSNPLESAIFFLTEYNVFLRALFVQWSRTPGSQPGNRGSNPLESAIFLYFTPVRHMFLRFFIHRRKQCQAGFFCILSSFIRSEGF